MIRDVLPSRQGIEPRQETAQRTIFACASAQGRAGIAVFRISGREALSCLESFCGKQSYQPRFAYYRTLRHPETNAIIDRGLVFYFQSPESFTGEDCVEFHLHGSPAVFEALIKAFHAFGLSQAEAGEFTKRACLHGKMDLLQAEGLADLIDAETELQHQQAYGQMTGALSGFYRNWRYSLLEIMSWIEADLDFPDEEAIPKTLQMKIQASLVKLIESMKKHLAQEKTGQSIREGLNFVLVGAANAGKSSVLNRLLETDRAIVTEIAGTTRDILEGRQVLAGMAVHFGDTAGFRKTEDQIEKEGIKRALAYAEKADLRLVVIDGSQLEGSLEKLGKSLEIFSTSSQEEKKKNLLTLRNHDIILINKIDLLNKTRQTVEKKKFLSSENLQNRDKKTASALQKKGLGKGSFLETLSEQKIGERADQSCKVLRKEDKTFFIFEVSALTGQGFPMVKEALIEMIKARFSLKENPYLTRTRHRLAVEKALEALERAIENLPFSIELSGEDLRLAKQALEELIGFIGIEDLFDKIFSDFCIGK